MRRRRTGKGAGAVSSASMARSRRLPCRGGHPPTDDPEDGRPRRYRSDSVDAAFDKGMKDKAKEFREGGVEIYKEV